MKHLTHCEHFHATSNTLAQTCKWIDSFLSGGKRKNTFPPIENHQDGYDVMQIPIDLQIYTNCSGHLSKQRLGSRKKSENQRGPCGRRGLVLSPVSLLFPRLFFLKQCVHTEWFLHVFTCFYGHVHSHCAGYSGSHKVCRASLASSWGAAFPPRILG